MKIRREFAMVICAAGCAIALMIPAPKPGLILAANGTPPMAADADAGNATANDTVMIALRLEASTALENLQGGGRTRQ